MIYMNLFLHVIILTASCLPLTFSQTTMSLNTKIPHNDTNAGALTFSNEDFTSSLVLKNYRNIQYYGEIAVGTPPQTFNVMFDTTAKISWLPARTNYGSCGSRHTRFNELATYTYVDLGNVTTMRINGVYSELQLITETVTVGKYTVKNQKIGLLKDGSCVGSKYDGVVGLGLWNDDGFQVMQSVMDQNNLTAPLVSFYLNRKEPGEIEKMGGELFIAGWNSDFIADTSKVSFIPVITQYPDTDWIIPISEVKMNSKGRTSTLGTDSRALIDTGTSFILAPETTVHELLSQVNSYPSDGFNYVECSRVIDLPSISFLINNEEYKLEGNDYMLKEITKKGYCALGIGIAESYAPYDWVLGDVFISKYYTVFNYRERSVAFAPLRSGSIRSRSLQPLFNLLVTFISLAIGNFFYRNST